MYTILSPLNVQNESTRVYFSDQLLVAVLQLIKLLVKGSIGCGILARSVSNQTRTETNQDIFALQKLECNHVTNINLTYEFSGIINNPIITIANCYSQTPEASQLSPIND